MARNYILNLGEEARKGMTEKARAGIYPRCAPVGYKNVDSGNGKRTIVPDPDSAPVVSEICERFSAGRHSVKALVRELNSEGVQLRGRSSIAAMFTISLGSVCTVAISNGARTTH